MARLDSGGICEHAPSQGRAHIRHGWEHTRKGRVLTEQHAWAAPASFLTRYTTSFAVPVLVRNSTYAPPAVPLAPEAPISTSGVPSPFQSPTGRTVLPKATLLEMGYRPTDMKHGCRGKGARGDTEDRVHTK
jgi:hypothetical protein